MRAERGERRGVKPCAPPRPKGGGSKSKLHQGDKSSDEPTKQRKGEQDWPLRPETLVQGRRSGGIRARAPARPQQQPRPVPEQGQLCAVPLAAPSSSSRRRLLLSVWLPEDTPCAAWKRVELGAGRASTAGKAASGKQQEARR
ncbi:unnamed protein product [Natator depressus]